MKRALLVVLFLVIGFAALKGPEVNRHFNAKAVWRPVEGQGFTCEAPVSLASKPFLDGGTAVGGLLGERFYLAAHQPMLKAGFDSSKFGSAEWAQVAEARNQFKAGIQKSALQGGSLVFGDASGFTGKTSDGGYVEVRFIEDGAHLFILHAELRPFLVMKPSRDDFKKAKVDFDRFFASFQKT